MIGILAEVKKNGANMKGKKGQLKRSSIGSCKATLLRLRHRSEKADGFGGFD
jgi:hypothetical protein